MLVRYQDRKLWQSYPDLATLPSIQHAGAPLVLVLSLVKFTLDLGLAAVGGCLAVTLTHNPQLFLQVLPPLELDSNFGFLTPGTGTGF